jgi:Domain of Unknown Function (DUF1080)
MKRFAAGTVLIGSVLVGWTGFGLSADADEGTVRLFNGKDLSNFYTYLAAPVKGEKPFGKNNDPEKVFTVEDGIIHISGKVWGGLITEKEYEDYRLIAEFRWGEKTWAPRAENARDSGILLHCVGRDGAVGGTWMKSFECQMIEGGTGDLILVGGDKSGLQLTVDAEKRDGQYYFKPGAAAVTLSSGRFNWYGRDPNWKDVKGFRGDQDVEKPVGEWNTIECTCEGDKISIRLNGTPVNAGRQASHTRGKILLQSEGAEVFFRRVDLVPLSRP